MPEDRSFSPPFRTPARRPGLIGIGLALMVLLLAIGLVLWGTFGKEGENPARACERFTAENGGTTSSYESCMSDEADKTGVDAALPWFTAAGVVGALTAILAVVGSVRRGSRPPDGNYPARQSSS